jgi:hypothetical protein
MFWQHAGTYCLHMVISEKNALGNFGAIFFTKLLWMSPIVFSVRGQVAKICI